MNNIKNTLIAIIIAGFVTVGWYFLMNGWGL